MPQAQKDAERFPIGRTALGGAAGGFTYDGALQDAVAREQRLRRPLRLPAWPERPTRAMASSLPREQAEPARSDLAV
jgi:hypothetical protein